MPKNGTRWFWPRLFHGLNTESELTELRKINMCDSVARANDMRAHAYIHMQTVTHPHPLVHTNHPRPHSYTHLRTWLLACNICTAICVLNVNWMLESAGGGIVLISIPINPSHDKVFIRSTYSHGLHIPQQSLYSSSLSLTHLFPIIGVSSNPPRWRECKTATLQLNPTRVTICFGD